MPRVKQTLASYLSPDLASSLKALTLPIKPLRASSALVNKGYAAAGQAGTCLHTMAVLQAYQADLLKVLDEGERFHAEDIQWGKKVFSQPPIVQVLPLKKMREACNFHHRYTSTMRDKIRKKKSRKSHCRIFTEFICKLWWKMSIWSITKFHLNTLLYTLCWQWQRSNVFCKSSQGFHTLLLVFWPIPPCRSPLEQWCFGAVAGQHRLSTPSKDFLWGWDLETG